MTHVVSKPHAPVVSSSGKLTVHQIPAAEDNFVWLMAAKDGEGAVVDGPDAEGAIAYAAAHGIRITTILNTHTHGDHIGINRDFERRGLLAKMRVVGSRLAQSDVPGITEAVGEGDSVTFGGVAGKVLLTEGHINGHISFLFEDLLFCGDTLFGAGCGYLFDGPPAKMHRSLERLAALDGATHVFCAHEYTSDNLRFAYSLEPDSADLKARIRAAWALRGQGGATIPSTIELERRTNPFLRHASKSLQDAVRRAMPDRALSTPEEIFTATRALKDRKDYKKIQDAELPI